MPKRSRLSPQILATLTRLEIAVDQPKRPRSRGGSRLEESLALQIRAAGLPEPAREYRFAPPRRWRADFAWPAHRLLVEVEGGIWSGGRHTRGQGYLDDCTKYNEAAVAGWRLLRVCDRHLQSGEAMRWIKILLDAPETGR